jgi:hypothetical protein
VVKNKLQLFNNFFLAMRAGEELTCKIVKETKHNKLKPVLSIPNHGWWNGAAKTVE